jgi:hypothetical protein
MEKQLVIPDSLLNFVQSHCSDVTINNQNGHDLFAGNGGEMRDLPSIFVEFNVSKRETSSYKTA